MDLPIYAHQAWPRFVAIETLEPRILLSGAEAGVLAALPPAIAGTQSVATIEVNGDEPLDYEPCLLTNRGITVGADGIETIDTSELQVTDDWDGTPAEELVYTLTVPPTVGELKRDGTVLSEGDTFTQQDIDDGLLAFTHSSSENVYDSFKFTVSDGDGGSIPETTFYCSIVVTPDVPALQIELKLYEDDGGSPGLEITDDTVTIGESFFVEVLVGDIRTCPAGLIALSLDITWPAGNFEEIDSPFAPAAPTSPIVASKFPLFRGGTRDQAAGFIDELKGGSLPDFQTCDPPYWGDPIGVGALERFSLMRFRAEAATAGPVPLSYVIGTNGLSFRDAASFVEDFEQQTITVVPEGGMADAVDDTDATDEDTKLTVPAPGVLENDIGDGLTVSSADTESAHGVPVTVDANGGFVYDPIGKLDFLVEGQTFTDTFDYIATDGVETDTATVTITVTGINDDPTIDSLGISGPIHENDTATLSGTYSDPDSGNTHELDVDWDGDGSFDQTVTVNGGSFSVQHQYLDDDPTATPSDTFDVNVRLRDNDGGSDTDSTSLTVNNVAPTLSGVSATPTDENGTSTLTGTISDPGTLDTFSVQVNWGDGSGVETFNYPAGTTSFSETHQYFDDDPSDTPSDDFTISLTVEDDDTGMGTATTPVTVINVAPVITGVTVDPTVEEGGTATLSGRFTDVGTLDTHTVMIDWGDGSAPTPAAVDPAVRTFAAEHQYLDDNPSGTPSDDYTITVTVTDDDSLTVTDTMPVTVTNAAPQIADVTVDPSVDEGGTATLSGRFTDVGTLDTHTVMVDWGDDSAPTPASVDQAQDSFTATHQYLDDNPSGTSSDDYTITVTVTDDDSLTVTDTMPVTVTNVAPVITDMTVDSTVEEGGTATLSGSFTDVGTLDTHTVMIDWGDGSAPTPASVDQAQDSFTATHQYLDDEPSGTSSDDYTITLTVTDDDTLAITDTMPVTVNNVAPTPTILGAPDSSVEGTPIDLDSSVDDPSTLDTFTYDWSVKKDGSPFDTGSGPDFSFTPPDDGLYDVTLTVTDDDTGVGTDSASITVEPGANEPPVAKDDQDTTDEDSAVTFNVLSNDMDPEGGELTISDVDTTGLKGGLTDHGDGKFTYDPAKKFEDLGTGAVFTETFTYTIADDAGLTDDATVSITITGVNDDPVGTDDVGATDENTPLTVPAAELLENDFDPEQDPIALKWVSPLSAFGIPVVLNTNDTVTYDPSGLLEYLAEGDWVTDTYTYKIDDGNGGSDEVTVEIHVGGVNDDPLPGDDMGQTDEDTPLTTLPDELLANDFDPEDDPLTVTGVSPFSDLGAAVTLNPDGSITYDPTDALDDLGLGETLTDTYDYMVGDGNGGVGMATVYLFVDGVNDPPVAMDGGFNVPQDGSHAGAMPADDPDLFDMLTWDVTSGPTHGTIVDFDPITGTFIYEPDLGYTGPDAFDFDVTDGLEQSNTATMTIVVNPTGQEFEAIIDDGDPGYGETGDVWTGSFSAGHEGDYRQSAGGPGTGDNTASWTFQGVPMGRYMVSATWKPSRSWSRARDAVYTVLDDGEIQGTAQVDMKYAPNDLVAYGTSWECLGLFNSTSGALTVELTDDADGKVIADAVYVRRIGPADPPVIGAVVVEANPSAVGATVNVIAQDVTATDATVNGVTFYFGAVPSADVLLYDFDFSGYIAVGMDADGSDGWSVPHLTAGLDPGTYAYIARALDSQGRLSDVAWDLATLVDPDAGFIIDNGDAGYGETGNDWTTSYSAGYDGDYRQSADGPGTGENTASWSVGGLPAGMYMVHTTWKPSRGWSRATDAAYTLYGNGAALVTTSVNMKGSPGDLNADGALWDSLGPVSLTGAETTLTVTLTDDANGKVIADAVRIQRIGSLVVEANPSAVGSVVSLTANYVDPTAATVHFYRDLDGNRMLDTAVDELIDTDVDGADGWRVEYSTLGLAAGTYDYFAEAADGAAQVVGVGAGTGRLFDPVAGFIIDNGDAGYVRNGAGWTRSHNVGGFASDYDQVGPGTGGNVATWTFSGLELGTYRVSATWKPRSTNRATNAPFTLFDGAAPLGTVAIDMTDPADDFSDAGASWEDLGAFEITSSTLTVQLSDAGTDSFVIADAIRIEWLATP